MSLWTRSNLNVRIIMSRKVGVIHTLKNPNLRSPSSFSHSAQGSMIRIFWSVFLVAINKLTLSTFSKQCLWSSFPSIARLCLSYGNLHIVVHKQSCGMSCSFNQFFDWIELANIMMLEHWAVVWPLRHIRPKLLWAIS